MKVLMVVALLLRSSSSLTFGEYKEMFNKTYENMEHNQRGAIFSIQSNLILNHQNMFKSGIESYNVDYNPITDTGFNDKFRRSFEALPKNVVLPTGEDVVIYRDLIPDVFELELPPTEIFDQSEYWVETKKGTLGFPFFYSFVHRKKEILAGKHRVHLIHLEV